MKLKLKDHEYFEIYFNKDQVQIVFGHLYYDVHHGFSQVYKDNIETNSIRVVLDRLDSRCAKYTKEIKEYMNDNQYYFAIYKLDRDDVTYYIKDINSNRNISIKSSLFDLVEDKILTKTDAQLL